MWKSSDWPSLIVQSKFRNIVIFSDEGYRLNFFFNMKSRVGGLWLYWNNGHNTTVLCMASYAVQLAAFSCTK